MNLIKADTKSWQIGKLMAGGSFRIPVADSGRITLMTSAKAGVCKTHIPGYSYLLTIGSDDVLNATEGKWSGRSLPWTFCYGIRSGIAFKLNKVLYLSGALSYFGAAPEETRYVVSPGGTMGKYKAKYPLNTLSAEVGIEVQL